MVYVSRKSHFCAAHRYYHESLSMEENRSLFGQCVNTHGHNYELEVTVTGEVNQQTGMIVNLSDLDAITKQRVIKVLDHRNLQVDVEEFRHTIPTTEMLVKFIWKQLYGHIPGARLVRVRLYEDSTLFVDYYGEAGKED